MMRPVEIMNDNRQNENRKKICWLIDVITVIPMLKLNKYLVVFKEYFSFWFKSLHS